MTDESLFIAALEMPTPAERRVFLDSACAGDPARRQRLDQLLAGHDQAAGILDHSTALPGPAETANWMNPPAERAGAVLAGRYQLLEEVGAGGMGSVWAAEQSQPVRRKVAVKLVKAGMDSKTVLARFEAERQALAVMDHPNIAKVLDGGTTDAGRPFFVMEYVRGVPLTAYCADARLSVADRLALFVPVCQAVQHAHQKGIIHRDLKPSNILVRLSDGRPVPNVIDFGLAKALHQPLTEHTLHTGHGQMLGTPLYMSPEQAEFGNPDVDTRADVYALGVILYELLTGTTPLERDRLRRTAWDELLRLIREEEPPRPSHRLAQTRTAELGTRNEKPNSTWERIRAALPSAPRSAFRGPHFQELDWIVMKCLEKDRTRRYETANGLAADVQRYLANEPVDACPPTAAYRLRKFVRRNTVGLATAAAFALMLIAATAVSVGLASWAIRERNRAELQKQKVEDEKRASEANFRRAVDAVDQMLTRVGESKLVHVPQMESIRRELLQDALRFYRQFLAEKANDPAVKLETANAHTRVGLILYEFGQFDESAESYRQALTHLDQLSADSPDDPTLTHKRAGIHAQIGLLHTGLGQFSQAVRSYRQAESLWGELGRRHPEDQKARVSAAKLHNNLIIVYRRMGAIDDAVATFLKGRAALNDVLATNPDHTECREALALCHQNIAQGYAAQDKRSDAEAAHLKAMELCRQLLRDQPDSVKFQKYLAQTCNNLALFYSSQQDHEKAAPLYKESLAINEILFRDYPKVTQFAIEAAGSYGNMAQHVRVTRSVRESLEWSDKAIRTVEPIVERNPKDAQARVTLFNALARRSRAYDTLGRIEDTRTDRKRLIALSEGQSHINMRLSRPYHLARLGEHAKAAAEVDALVEAGQTQGWNLYTFSYVLARCAASAGQDEQLPSEERERLTETYGTRAVALLRQAAAVGGFKDPDTLNDVKTNKEFDPIRSRDDFRTLLAEWERKNRTKPEVLPAPRPVK